MITSIKARKQDAISVHNPNNILIDVVYDNIDNKPYILNAEIFVASEDSGLFVNSIGIFNPYLYEFDDDNLSVTFRLDGSRLFYSLLYDYDDYLSQEKVVERVPYMTKDLKVIFTSTEENNTIEDIFYTTIVNSSTQLLERYDPVSFLSDTVLYIGAEQNVVYLYMYSDSYKSPIVIDPTADQYEEDYLSDYDDAIFYDYDDSSFVANILI